MARRHIDWESVVIWALIVLMTLVICTVGWYRFYIAEENVYLLNDYLKGR